MALCQLLNHLVMEPVSELLVSVEDLSYNLTGINTN